MQTSAPNPKWLTVYPIYVVFQMIKAYLYIKTFLFHSLSTL